MLHHTLLIQLHHHGQGGKVEGIQQAVRQLRRIGHEPVHIHQQHACTAVFRNHTLHGSQHFLTGLAVRRIKHHIRRRPLEFPQPKLPCAAPRYKQTGLAAQHARNCQIRHRGAHRRPGAKVQQQLTQRHHLRPVLRRIPHIRELNVLFHERHGSLAEHLRFPGRYIIQKVAHILLKGIHTPLPERSGGHIIGHIHHVGNLQRIPKSSKKLVQGSHLRGLAIDIGPGGKFPGQQEFQRRRIQSTAQNFSGRRHQEHARSLQHTIEPLPVCGFRRPYVRNAFKIGHIGLP